MRPLLKYLAWTPVVGVVWEIGNVPPYLSDTRRPIRFWGSVMWHGAVIPTLFVWAMSSCVAHKVSETPSAALFGRQSAEYDKGFKDGMNEALRIMETPPKSQ